MGDESQQDWQIWLDEYDTVVGNITITYDDILSNDILSTYEFDGYKDWTYSQTTHNDITLTGGGEEMLRIDKDGFYVRGVRVEADAKEAEQVYKAFKEWLTWASLSKTDEE